MGRLTAAQRAYIRRHTQAAREDAPGSGELNIVPFLDITVNLMMFLLATTSLVMSSAQVDAQLPTHGRGPRAPLSFSVTLADQGIYVTAMGKRLAPGCAAPASGPAPTIAGRDYAALTRCAAAVKRLDPRERQVTISADPSVPYEQVMHALDAVRHSGSNELFPDPLISAGVR